jgi:hypothetical protein
MGELLDAWRALERHVERMPPDAPRAAECRALIDTMRANYHRLQRVYPRSEEDTQLARALGAEAYALIEGD